MTKFKPNDIVFIADCQMSIVRKVRLIKVTIDTKYSIWHTSQGDWSDSYLHDTFEEALFVLRI